MNISSLFDINIIPGTFDSPDLGANFYSQLHGKSYLNNKSSYTQDLWEFDMLLQVMEGVTREVW